MKERERGKGTREDSERGRRERKSVCVYVHVVEYSKACGERV